MAPRARSSSKPGAPSAGTPSITSFFMKKTDSQASGKGQDGALSPTGTKAVNHEVTPPKEKVATASSPATSSSGAKTASKRQNDKPARDIASSDLPKKMDLHDASPETPKNDSKRDSAQSPVETVTISSESPPETATPCEGSRVEVLFDKKDWYKGTLSVFDEKKRTWRVKFDDGEEGHVSFPDPEVRILNEEGCLPQPEQEADAPLPGGRKRRAAAAIKKYILEESDNSDNNEDSSPEKKSSGSAEKEKALGSQRKRVRRVQDSDSEEEFKGEVEESSESEEEEPESISSDEEEDAKKSRAGSKRKSAGAAKGQSSAPKRIAAASSAPDSKSSTPRSTDTPKAVPASRNSFDKNTVAEQKKAKQANFEAKNQQRYKWLEDIRDAKGRRPNEEGYDPRTLLVPASAYNSFTNFEKQFWDIKKVNFDVVLFFKKGKFYEMFEGDADVGHNLLHLKLTDRTNMRMCGIPEGQFATYASQLVGRGFKVGRVEQMETMNAMQKRAQSSNAPKSGQVCERELCQVLTQGTITDEAMLGGSHANFLLALCHGGQGGSECGVCLLEASTGVFFVGQFQDDVMHANLETLLLRARPKELVFPKSGLDQVTMKLIRRHLQNPILNAVDPDEQFWDDERTAFEIDAAGYFRDDAEGEGDAPAPWPEVLEQVRSKGQKLALSAVGGCLWYLRSVKLDSELASMRNFRPYGEFDGSSRGSLVVDGQTLNNLEILENSSGGSEGTLLKLLDKCVTGFGRRKFRGWVCAPLRDPARINERLDAAERLASDPRSREELVRLLRKLPDVERSLSKVHMQASGRKQGVMFDNSSARRLRAFLQLLDAIQLLCDLRDTLQEHGLVAGEGAEEGSGQAALPLVHFPSALRETLDKFKASYGDLHKAMEEGFITPEAGVYEDYDAAVERVARLEAGMEEEAQGWRKTLKERSLKFWHPAAGKEPYQLEVPTSWLEARGNKLPAEFELKSQTSKARRYWTPSIRARVLEMVDAKEALAELREGMARRMQTDFDAHYAVWQQAVEAGANLDCLISLSFTTEGAGDGPTCRPELLEQSGGEEATLELRDSWHPCLSGRGDGAFIHNDIVLGAAEQGERAEEGRRACVVTGPNMGGKSTLLRQACVTVMMAQLGAFVPATTCRLRCCDRIFTRIGASDRIMAGQSTFLVELAETATILRHATARSLVVLDELGRGTSTHDGFAIAGAVLSHLVAHVRPLLLFSTHYHALTDELRHSRDVGLYHMDCLVNDQDRSVTFLYKFRLGVAADSYGLHCAKAAGLPASLVERAAEKRGQLEAAGEHQKVRQLSLFKSAARLASASAVRADAASILSLQQAVLAALAHAGDAAA